jgi:hypothetical protein
MSFFTIDLWSGVGVFHAEIVLFLITYSKTIVIIFDTLKITRVLKSPVEIMTK